MQEEKKQAAENEKRDIKLDFIGNNIFNIYIAFNLVDYKTIK